MLVTATSKINVTNPALNLIESKSYFRALWQICFPLMLSAFSGTFMIFIDRIILAKYGTESMIAATTASNIFLVFQYGVFYIAMIAEVFVGHFNGASQFSDVGKPVWQMIWFSLICGILMVPIGIFGQDIFIPNELAQEGSAYFKWMMIFGATGPLIAAISAFFIGRGKVKIVTLMVILGNVLNALLVPSFVFGLKGILPPMGAKGAAIATGIAQLCVVLILFAIFLRPHYQKLYGTHHWRFNKNLFIKCIKIGFPNAVGHMTATAAWAIAMYLLVKTSMDHVTVVSIGMSIWMLFTFITEGLQQGVTSLTANCIGANKKSAVSEILTAGLQLQFVLALVLAIPLVLMPSTLVSFFMPIQANELVDIAHLRGLIELSCRWLWLAYLFDGMAWVIDGILTAAGDTGFIMIMNSLGTWFFFIVPIYFFVVKIGGAPMMTLQLIAIFCLILFASYYLRYKSQKWQKKSVIIFEK